MVTIISCIFLVNYKYLIIIFIFSVKINIPKFNQQRVSMVKYLGELFNYQLVETDVIFATLYSLITFGSSADCMDHLYLFLYAKFSLWYRKVSTFNVSIIYGLVFTMHSLYYFESISTILFKHGL